MKTARRPKPKPVRPPLKPGTRLLAFDVSSTAAGFALMEATEGKPRLIATRLIKPPAKDKLLWRVDDIADNAAWFAQEHVAPLLIMEWTDGARWGNGGRAAGWVNRVGPLTAAQAAARQAVRKHVLTIETVTSTEWTRKVSKEDRADNMAAMYFKYACIRELDKGLDIADAIGIGVWRCGIR